MNLLLQKLLAPRSIEYLILNRDFIILEASVGMQRFTNCLYKGILGQDIRVYFPEIIGVENLLSAVLQGQQASFDLRGVDKSLDSSHSLYIDLYAIAHQDETTQENGLIVLIEDVTEKMVLTQSLVQRANEAELLLSALATSKDYINKIIASMADALFIISESGIIKTVNQATQDLFGYQETELLQQPINLIVPNQEMFLQFNQQLLGNHGEILRTREVVCQTKSGKEIVVEFSCSVIQTEIKGLYDFVYLGRDITESKQAEAKIFQALEKEKALNELKSSFISVASHQFRTPLTTIRVSTELLENYSHNLTEERKGQYFQQIRSAIHQMTELMDDVLILSKAEAGKIDFNPTWIDLTKFCHDLVEEMQLSDSNQHALSFVCQCACTNAYIDTKLLRHILTNLLSNALKYSPPNSPIHFFLTCQDGEAIFEIQDHGIGIPLENQSRLFETFHRAHNVGKIPGTGLGLAIAKNYVDLHGGKITFTSEAGVGTTFKVTIPLGDSCQTSQVSSLLDS